LPLRIHGKKAIIYQSFNRLPDIVLAGYWADDFEDYEAQQNANKWTTEAWQKRLVKMNKSVSIS